MTATPSGTPLYRLLEQRLGQPLAEYVATSRAAGRSWRTMAAELTDRTGVEVSNEALRLWFRGRLQVRVEVAA